MLPVLALLCAASTIEAQAPAAPPTTPASPAPATAPEAPKPAPELQKLAFLVGDWIHEETYQPGPTGAGGPGKARSKASWVLGNQHLYVIYASKTTMGQFEGRGFFGWDPQRRQYRFDWFNNSGAATHYSGDFDAQGSLVLTGEIVSEGKAVSERFTVKPQPEGKVLFTSAVAGPDGAMKTVFESLATPDTKK
jgi:hypothetical protein